MKKYIIFGQSAFLSDIFDLIHANDTEMCIRHFVLHEEIMRPVIRSGRFNRVIEDFFVGGSEYELLKKEGKIENRN